MSVLLEIFNYFLSIALIVLIFLLLRKVNKIRNNTLSLYQNLVKIFNERTEFENERFNSLDDKFEKRKAKTIYKPKPRKPKEDKSNKSKDTSHS